MAFFCSGCSVLRHDAHCKSLSPQPFNPCPSCTLLSMPEPNPNHRTDYREPLPAGIKMIRPQLRVIGHNITPLTSSQRCFYDPFASFFPAISFTQPQCVKSSGGFKVTAVASWSSRLVSECVLFIHSITSLLIYLFIYSGCIN